MQKPLVVLISGGTCSGKSEFATWFENSILVSMDRFYMPLSLVPKTKSGNLDFDHPKAVAIDECKDAVQKLLTAGKVHVPLYDFLKNDRVGKEVIRLTKQTKFIVVEGMFALYSPLLELGHIKIFLDTPSEVRVARRMIRDMKRKKRTHQETLADFIHTEKRYNEFVKPTKKYADLIIPFSMNPMQVLKTS